MSATTDHWADDKLGRSEDAKYIATFLRNRSRELVDQKRNKSFVLNLDARWGDGKTFFLERLKKDLESAGHVAVYVNAWQDDFADDPLTAAIAAIDAEVTKHKSIKSPARKVWDKAKNSGGEIARQIGKGLLLRGLSLLVTEGVAVGIDASISGTDENSSNYAAAIRKGGKEAAQSINDSIYKLANQHAKNSITEFVVARQSIENFKNNLRTFLKKISDEKNIPMPLFVLIDELDRCRPPYAIAMLERIKHLFEVPDVVFVIATDSSQLVHSIGAVYGVNFDSNEYIKRFFDLTYTFDEPNVNDLVSFLLSTQPLAPEKIKAPLDLDFHSFVSNFFSKSGGVIRSIEQMYDHLKAVCSSWSEKTPLELAIILPLILAYNQNRREFYSNPSESFRRVVLKDWQYEYYSLNAQLKREQRTMDMKTIMHKLWDAVQIDMN